MNNAQLFRESEPIRFLETPRSLSEYILIADVITKAALSPSPYLKTLNVGPAGVELATSRMAFPVLNQLSHRCAVTQLKTALIALASEFSFGGKS